MRNVTIAVLVVILVILSTHAGAQTRAVGVAIDPIEADFQNARALSIEARTRYGEKRQELRGRVASGEISSSNAERLERWFYLEALEADLKATLGYIRVVKSKKVKNAMAREEIKKAVAMTKGAIGEARRQYQVMDRDIRENRGPAVLIALEYASLTGKAVPSIEQDERLLQELERVLDELGASETEGEQELRRLEASETRLEHEGPILDAWLLVANRRVDNIRIRAMLARSGVASTDPMPEDPNFEPLASLAPVVPDAPAPAGTIGDPEAVRRRLLRENRR